MKLSGKFWAAGAAILSVVVMASCSPQPPVRSNPQEKAPGESKPADKTGTKPAADAAARKQAVEVTAKTVVDVPAQPPAPKTVKPAAQLPKIPLGLEKADLAIPADNPMTPEKVELGRQLYFDTRLSKDGTVSCATCHDPKMAWAEHEPTSTGIGKQVGGRNSPSVINAAFASAQFWDGRAATLEEQAVGPIANPIEMGHDLPTMVKDLSKIQGYQERFQKVFGTGVTQEGVAKAIAAFERTVLSGNSAYDRFKAGDAKALNDSQKRGMELFEDKAQCATCHTPPVFSAFAYHNAGVGMDKSKPDEGRKDVTKNAKDLGKFRVPALREAANTAPYFHDGSAKTLEDAVALMAAGGKDNPNLSPILKGVRRAELTEQDRKDLVEFLKALSGEFPVVEPPKGM